MSFLRSISSAPILLLGFGPALEEQPNQSNSWEVISISDNGSATALRPGSGSTDVASVEFQCSGNPPSFDAVVRAPDDSEPRRSGAEPPFWGSIRFGAGPSRSALWYPGPGLHTPLQRAEIESLVAGPDSLHVEVEISGREPLRHDVSVSGVSDLVRRFLEACERHVLTVDRKFELEGIQVELKVEVDARSVEDIRSLAADFGIRDIEVMYVGPYGHPGSQLAAIVRSRAEIHGDSVTQAELYVRNRHWQIGRVGTDEVLVNRGEWQTSRGQFRSLDRWIVRDGDFQTEVALGSGVSYDQAVQIVRAIRRNTLVDRQGPRPPFEPLSTGPDDFMPFRGGTGPGIWLSDWASGDPSDPCYSAPCYEVRLPAGSTSGRFFTVRTVGETVELVGSGFWIS